MRKKGRICAASAGAAIIFVGVYVMSMTPGILIKAIKGDAKWNVGPLLADGSNSDTAVLSLKVTPGGYKAIVSGTGEFCSPSPGEWGKDLVILSAGWMVRIKKAEIEEGITAIGGGFGGCASLNEISLPESLEKISPLAFAYCDSLKNVSYAGTMEEWKKLTANSEGWADESSISAVRCADGEIGVSEIDDQIEEIPTRKTSFVLKE